MTTAGSILGAFVSPALFWGGSVAMAAPLIIHLLARRRFRRIRWAAMDFLMEAQRHNRRRVRLEELILLVLRCLAVLLIALIVSRPFVRPSGVAALLGGRERTERVFVIDDSFSMGYLSESESAFARAKRSVVHLIDRLREHAPDDTITILRTSRIDSPVVTGALLDDKQIEQILARLEAMNPSQKALSVDSVLAGVRTVLEGDPGIVSAAVYVVSDFQRIDWARWSGAGKRAGALADPLREWAGEHNSVRVVLVDVGDDAARNLAVTDLRAVRRQIVTGVEARFEARVANYTPRDSGPLELEVVTGPAARASARLDHVPAGRSAAATIRAFFQRAGDETLRVALPPDNLPVDNVRTLAVEVAEAVRVLVVNGEPAGDSYLDEVYLLTTALSPAGEVFSGNRVETIEESALDGVLFDKYQVVILCNLYRISEPVADALHRYVAGGGGLAIFLGDQVSDPAVYNAALYRDGEGLLPASLEHIVRAPDAGVLLAGGDFLHPVVRVFAGRDNPFLKRIAFHQYYATEPAGALPGTPEGDPSPGAGAAFRPSTRIIARFADTEGTEAIMERHYGRGRVILFTSSCDLEWNDWARDPSYVVTMLEIAQYLASSGQEHRSRHVGEELILDVDPSEYEPSALIRGPGYPQQKEEEVAATAAEDGGLRIVWPHTDRAGVYSFFMWRRDGGQVVRRFAVNVDEQESDLSPATEEELRQALVGVEVEYLAGVAAASDESDEGRRELWPLFLAAAMTVLMVEQFLAWRFGRR